MIDLSSTALKFSEKFENYLEISFESVIDYEKMRSFLCEFCVIKSPKIED
jgi:hypothetical protein